MTRKSQKDQEKALAEKFLFAYFQDPSQIKIELYDDDKPEKLDVIAYDLSNPDEKRFNFQVKVIPFHPDDKTHKDFSDEMGAMNTLKKGKTPRMKTHDNQRSPWQTAVKKEVAKWSQDYTTNQKQYMDLLILINDSSLPDSKEALNNFDSHGFRSINCIHWGGRFSIALSANENAPMTLQKNLKKRVQWKGED